MFWSFLSGLAGGAGIGQIAADIGKGMVSNAVEGMTAPAAGMLNDIGKLTGSEGLTNAGKSLSNLPNTLVGRGDIPLKDKELPTAFGDPARRLALQMPQKKQEELKAEPPPPLPRPLSPWEQNKRRAISGWQQRKAPLQGR